jgi:hypothetical protein
LPILLSVNEQQPNSESDQQNELALLLQKKSQRELSRLDVQRIMELEWVLNGTWDEVDNYDKYLSPEAKEFLHEKFPPVGTR